MDNQDKKPVDDPCDDVVHWLPIPESPKKHKETKDDN